MSKYKILAIPATARHSVAQQEIVKHLQTLNGIDLRLQLFDKLADLPLYYNAGLNFDPAEPVVNFCRQVREADAVILYLPEFTFGVPGALNNALKWALPFDVFKDKFVGLITTAQTKNTTMQRFINEISSQLYPVATMRIYYLPHNLGPENQRAELQCGKTLQIMITDARQYFNKHKLTAVA